jgi:hypothetical protein
MWIGLLAAAATRGRAASREEAEFWLSDWSVGRVRPGKAGGIGAGTAEVERGRGGQGIGEPIPNTIRVIRSRAGCAHRLAFRTPFSAHGFLFLNGSETWAGNGELTFKRAQAPTEESEEPKSRGHPFRAGPGQIRTDRQARCWPAGG